MIDPTTVTVHETLSQIPEDDRGRLGLLLDSMEAAGKPMNEQDAELFCEMSRVGELVIAHYLRRSEDSPLSAGVSILLSQLASAANRAQQNATDPSLLIGGLWEVRESLATAAYVSVLTEWVKAGKPPLHPKTEA